MENKPNFFCRNLTEFPRIGFLQQAGSFRFWKLSELLGEQLSTFWFSFSLLSVYNFALCFQDIQASQLVFSGEEVAAPLAYMRNTAAEQD